MKGKRVLVVDDDRAMVESLSDILELHGWTAFQAFDGREAVALAEAHHVDAVVMDIQMPRLNGADALGVIRTRRPSLPVILITAIAPREILSQIEREGGVRVLRKPLDIPLVLDVLDRAVA